MANGLPTVEELREELGNPPVEDISDATLQRLIEKHKTLYGAASHAAEILARHYATKAEKTIGDYRVSYAESASRWKELAGELKRKAAIFGAKPYAGGISKSAKRRGWLDEDRPKPDFWRGMWDYRD